MRRSEPAISRERPPSADPYIAMRRSSGPTSQGPSATDAPAMRKAYVPMQIAASVR